MELGTTRGGERLDALTPGQPILYGGRRIARVSPELAGAFRPGDRLIVVQATGDLLRVPGPVHELVEQTVTRAVTAFGALARVTDGAITRFYALFADRLRDDEVWTRIGAANAADVAAARERGRSTTRLLADDRMRQGMIAGLRAWQAAPTLRGRVLETVRHEGWKVDQIVAPLGVVAFVFEARPNVFADATGVLRGGNSVIFRIGSDALGTARAIVEHALDPALMEAGLPEGAVSLLPSGDRAAGWAMFSDPRLALAVARGSGQAVAQLGSVARQAGIPVSLHGTGGAWLVAGLAAEGDRFEAAVRHSLDRKVCNTLNVCCIPRSRAAEFVPRFLRALEQAGEQRGFGCRLHVVEEDRDAVPAEWFQRKTTVRRAHGDVEEHGATLLGLEGLATEWEWEETPEVSLKLVSTLDEATALCNRFSPQFVASLVSQDPEEHDRFFAAVNAPFVGNGFTRWVDGQYALNRPELGLSNWQHGRLFARGGILSGDGVFTLRTRVTQESPDVHR
jgi:glutamate-5-semialdehyde dehydrogenase